MPEKMRIGELLLLKEKIDPWLLSQTLNEQARSGQRLVSLLVSRAQLDPDDGALLLSEQLGYPAALQRHLERRDPAMLELVPRPLGSRWVVLPLFRARTGAIVVVARDPTPILSAALEHAMRDRVVLAVTPAVQLDRLVRATYGLPGAPEEPLPASAPTLSDIGNVRVEDETPLPIRRARTVSAVFKGPDTTIRVPPPHAPIEATLTEIDHAVTAAAVERLVMAYVAKRWRSSLLARIIETRAVGLRGHGLAQGAPVDVTIELTEPSHIALAFARRQVIGPHEHDVSESQQRLAAALGGPTAAAPVIAAGEVVAVLTVGEAIEIATSEALAELDRLVDALGAAYDRFSR